MVVYMQAAEVVKAAGACRRELRRLRPPRELGRVAFCHDQFVVGPPIMASRVFLTAES